MAMTNENNFTSSTEPTPELVTTCICAYCYGVALLDEPTKVFHCKCGAAFTYEFAAELDHGDILTHTLGQQDEIRPAPENTYGLGSTAKKATSNKA